MSIFTGQAGVDAIARYRFAIAAIPQLAHLKDAPDAMLLRSLNAAANTLQARLGVLLEPTLILAEDITPADLPRPQSHQQPLRFSEEIVIPGPAAGILAPRGQQYLIEPGYDYEPNRQEHDGWGWIDLRQPQVIEVLDMRFSYGAPLGGFKLPLGWLRLDHKYGHLRIVPVSGQLQSLAMNGLVLGTLANGRRVPHAWRISYRAGIKDIHNEYPDLVDFIGRMATANLLKDSFPAQSGSISADGLSQSSSFDLNAFLGGGNGGGIDGELPVASLTII
jgi:hypothetical protein